MNLTQTSYYARLAIRIFFSLLILYVLALVFKTPIKNGIRSILPAKDPPNPVYGKLPPLEFIAQPVGGKIESFELNTPDGQLTSDIPAKMSVFKYVPKFLSFEAGKSAQEDASILGFAPSELISDFKSDKYIWRDINYNSILGIDLLTETINMTTPYSAIGSSYALGSINQKSSLEEANAFLKSMGKLEDSLYLQGTQQVVGGRFLGGKVVESSTPLETQLVQIDYFRSIFKTPILGPDPKKGLIRIVLGKPDQPNKKLNNPVVNVYEWEIDTITDASYPLIPISLAWENIAKGNGVIVNVTTGDQSPFENYQRTSIEKVVIEKIYIAYYDNTKPQEYLQPIYVFEGRYSNSVGDKGSITFYYPAIDGSFIKGTQEDSTTSKQEDIGTTPDTSTNQ